jgi:hypothetical protein
MDGLVFYGGVGDIQDCPGISVHGLDMAVHIDDDNPQGEALKNVNIMVVGRHGPICP